MPYPYDYENENENTKLLPIMKTKKLLPPEYIRAWSGIHKAVTHTTSTTYVLPVLCNVVRRYVSHVSIYIYIIQYEYDLFRL